MARAKEEKLVVGSVLEGVSRPVSFERTRWYEEASRYAGDGAVKQITTNIHTSDEYARNQGLPGAIADGMVTTHWCSNMLFDYFGMDYLERGELRTKFIKPTYLDKLISIRGQVTEVVEDADATTYSMDVWSEDEAGQKLMVGEAKVAVLNAA